MLFGVFCLFVFVGMEFLISLGEEQRLLASFRFCLPPTCWSQSLTFKSVAAVCEGGIHGTALCCDGIGLLSDDTNS